MSLKYLVIVILMILTGCTLMPEIPGSFDAILVRSQGSNNFYEGNQNGAIIHIKEEKISADEFFSYSENEISLLMSLYRMADSPYPGAVSNEIVCDEALRPKKYEGNVTYYLLYATNWFSYGACVWDLVTFKSIIYYVYCHNAKTGYKVEIFFPKDFPLQDYVGLLDRATC